MFMPTLRILAGLGLLVCSGCKGGDRFAANISHPTVDFSVRVHRAGGGPGGMNWTNTVRSNGDIENFGGEFLSCQPGISSLVERGVEADPARGRVPVLEIRNLRELLASEAFAKAKGADKVTSPAYDGIGGEVTVEAGGATRRLSFDFVAKQQEPVLDQVIVEVRRLVTQAGLDAACAPERKK